jgi:hypothetical protein
MNGKAPNFDLIDDRFRSVLRNPARTRSVINRPIGVSDLRETSRDPVNPSHVVMQNRLSAAIVPFDGNTGPICVSDEAPVSAVLLPTKTVADLELSRLSARHFFAKLTRFIS